MLFSILKKGSCIELYNVKTGWILVRLDSDGKIDHILDDIFGYKQPNEFIYVYLPSLFKILEEGKNYKLNNIYNILSELRENKIDNILN